MNDPTAPPPADHDPDDTGVIELDRRVLRLWRIRGVLGVAAPVLALAVLVGVTAEPVAGVATLAAVGVVAVAVVRWWTSLVWRSWRFRVGDRALELRHGVVIRHESTIPFHRVQHVDTEAGPLERRLGLTTFVLRTASASSDSTVPGIDAAHAEELRARILALVGTGDAV